MKINELFLESVRIPVNQKFTFDGIRYDNENGMGAVPFNSNVLYVGFAATMSAEGFIRLRQKLTEVMMQRNLLI